MIYERTANPIGKISVTLRKLYLSSVTRTGAIGLLSFIALYTTFPTQHLIILLNAVFVGGLAAVSTTFLPLMRDAMLGEGPYDRVRQMSLGVVLGWCALLCFVLNSITLRAFDPGTAPNTLLNALGRFIAIWTAVLQVTAPDFGQDYFYGRDRRFLWIGVAIGLIVAVVLIILQSADITAAR